MLPKVEEFLERMNVAPLMGEALEAVLDKYFEELVKIGDYYNPKQVCTPCCHSLRTGLLLLACST